MKGFYLACEIAKRAYKYTIMENLFPDDDSENYEVIFTEDQIHEMELLLACYSNFPNRQTLSGVDIFNIDIRKIEGFCSYDGNLSLHNFGGANRVPGYIHPESLEIAHFYNVQTKMLFEEEHEQCREVIEILKERLKFATGVKLAEFLRHQYMIPMQREYRKCISYLSEYNTKQTLQRLIEEGYNLGMDDTNHWLLSEIGKRERKKLHEELDLIYEDLLITQDLPKQWKSEFELYKLVKKHYEDARFQYSPDWLSPQRYDIFIPSLNIAIEYQGIQHFQSVDFFGGEEGYRHRIALDEKKRIKSKNNGVKVVEWLFTESMSKMMLDGKIKKALDNS